MAKITVNTLSNKNTLYELQVMAICSQLRYTDAWSLEDTNTERIARGINNDIAKLLRRSVGDPAAFYKAVVESSTRVVVNHLNIHGEVDKVIAEIDYEK
jgi:hypothetical protein